MLTKDQLLSDLTPILKSKAYKKKKQTWYKDTEDLIIIFNVQNSCYDNTDYYINLGIIIKKLYGSNIGISLSNCHIQQRIPETNDKGIPLSADVLSAALDLWEKWYGSMQSLRIKALEGKLPPYTTSEAITFLTTVRLA